MTEEEVPPHPTLCSSGTELRGCQELYYQYYQGWLQAGRQRSLLQKRLTRAEETMASAKKVYDDARHGLTRAEKTAASAKRVYDDFFDFCRNPKGRLWKEPQG